MNFSALYTILARFGPVIPEFTLLKKKELFWQYGKNLHITPYILEYPRTLITNFTGLVGIWVWMIIPIFVWQSLSACYFNSFKLETI